MTNKMERFTQRARHVLSVAQQEAEALKHHAIGTQHLLIGLIHEKSDVSGAVLAELNVAAERVRALAAAPDTDEPAASRLDIAPETKRLLERAVQEARELKHEFIGTEHLLLAITHQPECSAAVILQKLNIEAGEVQKRIIRLLRREEREVLRPGTKPIASLIRRRFTPIPVLEPQANPEVTHILNMVRDGKITADEGERLLNALPISDVSNPYDASVIHLDRLIPEGDPRYVRMVITDKTSGGTSFEVRIPVSQIPKAFETVIRAVHNNVEGSIATLDEHGYRIDLFLDRPADEEAS